MRGISGSEPAGYSGLQIALHWIIAVLVIGQVFLHEGVEAVFRAQLTGLEAPAGDIVMANVHVVAGITVLVLALFRLYLRIRYGAPPVPEDDPVVLRWVAIGSHWALYAIIIMMPISGILSWWRLSDVAPFAHSAGQIAVIAVVALHTAGALWQHFWLRSNVLVRMLRPAG